jgi:hypothetical protein
MRWTIAITGTEFSQSRPQTAIDAPFLFGNLVVMRTRQLTILAASLLPFAVTACGSGGGLTTGSLFSSKSAEPAMLQPPKPITASDRAVHVGATVARAQRCGFYFNPDEVRTNYLASETQAGTPPDVLQRAMKEFDFTRQAVVAAAAREDGYCTEGRTRDVKAALTKQLAGDFNPPQSRSTVDVGWWDHQKQERALDGNKVFDASQKKNGPRDAY